MEDFSQNGPRRTYMSLSIDFKHSLSDGNVFHNQRRLVQTAKYSKSPLAKLKSLREPISKIKESLKNEACVVYISFFFF